MDAIRKKMQSLKGETDGLYATIARYEESTKHSNSLADQVYEESTKHSNSLADQVYEESTLHSKILADQVRPPSTPTA